MTSKKKLENLSDEEIAALTKKSADKFGAGITDKFYKFVMEAFPILLSPFKQRLDTVENRIAKIEKEGVEAFNPDPTAMRPVDILKGMDRRADELLKLLSLDMSGAAAKELEDSLTEVLDQNSQGKTTEQSAIPPVSKPINGHSANGDRPSA